MQGFKLSICDAMRYAFHRHKPHPFQQHLHPHHMPTRHYYDAHCHWQDARLLPYAEQIQCDLDATGLVRAVVNGTCPQDWQAVADLALADPRVLPAFGLHPWRVNTAFYPEATSEKQQPPRQPHITDWQWLEQLKAYLQNFPRAAVGEIGLDNWIEGADNALQQKAFLAQLALAAEGNRPVSIHCLRADGDLLAALKAAPALPQRGIHLHGFAGSIETARQLLNLGAYFSFSEYLATPKRTKARALAEYIPLDRLLAETDAPDMMGPPEWQEYRLDGTTQPPPAIPRTPQSKPDSFPPTDKAAAQLIPLKHPANITAAYACLAQLRDIPLKELAAIVKNNFLKYFDC